MIVSLILAGMALGYLLGGGWGLLIVETAIAVGILLLARDTVQGLAEPVKEDDDSIPESARRFHGFTHLCVVASEITSAQWAWDHYGRRLLWELAESLDSASPEVLFGELWTYVDPSSPPCEDRDVPGPVILADLLDRLELR